MKHKEDIAVLIKQKLNGMHASSMEPSWEMVEKSLRRRKKKRLILWWSGSVLSLVLIALFIQNFNENSTPEQTDATKAIEATTANDQDKNTIPSSDKSNSNSPDSPSTNTEQLPDNVAGSNTASVGDKNEQEDAKPKQVTVTQFDSVDPTQGAEVKTTYYYYRDSDKTEIITKDKKVLDSLLENSASKVLKDSI